MNLAACLNVQSRSACSVICNLNITIKHNIYFLILTYWSIIKSIFQFLGIICCHIVLKCLSCLFGNLDFNLAANGEKVALKGGELVCSNGNVGIEAIALDELGLSLVTINFQSELNNSPPSATKK